jgi:hypothetical protein
MLAVYRSSLVWLLRLIGAGTAIYVGFNAVARVVGVFDAHGDALREVERIAMVSGVGFGFALILLAAAEVLAANTTRPR